MTLHDLAGEYGVSAERIRQIEVAAMKKMRKALAEDAPECVASAETKTALWGRFLLPAEAISAFRSAASASAPPP
jgi:hypothetical protein